MDTPEAPDSAAESPLLTAVPAQAVRPPQAAAEPDAPSAPAHVLSMEAAEKAGVAADESVAQVVQQISTSTG